MAGPRVPLDRTMTTEVRDFLEGLSTQVDSPQFSMRPWADVTHPKYGAVGDGTTNDLGAINAAINAVNAVGGGTVYFPPGLYYITDNIIIDGSVSLLGAGMNQTMITAGQNGGDSVYNDISVLVLTANASNITVSDMRLRGKGGWRDIGSFGASNPTLEINGGENTFRKIGVDGGAQDILVRGYDHLIDDVVISNAYDALLLTSVQGNFFRRIKADSGKTTGGNQGWPAWAAATAKSPGDLVINGTGSLYCTVGGTTGGSAPTNRNYGLDIIDGTVTWQLSAATGLICIHCLTNGTDGGEWHFSQIDLSGDFAASLVVDDQLSTDLSTVAFHESIFSNQIVIGSTLWTSFSQCEMPTDLSTNNKDVTITCCKANGLVVSGTFTGAGNIGIT